MKRSFVCSVVVLLISIQLCAGTLEPSAAPGPTMKRLDEVEPRIAVNSDNTPGNVGAGYEFSISSSGSYYLTGDISTNVTALRVDANDVTIDLMGFTISGPSANIHSGVYMDGRTNVEILNGTIRHFRRAIQEANSVGHGHRIIGIRATSNTKSGIELSGVSHLVKDCSVTDNGALAATGSVYGISTGESSNVINNSVNNNGYDSQNSYVYAINVGAKSLVAGNTVNDNGYSAVSDVYGIKAGDRCNIKGNTLSNNGAYDGAGSIGGVYGIFTGVGCLIDDNSVSKTGFYAEGDKVYGIKAGANCMIRDNLAYWNGYGASLSEDYGIYADTGCSVVGNTSNLNGVGAIGAKAGIYLAGDNFVDQNSATGNTGLNMDLTLPSCTYGTNHSPPGAP